MRIDRMDEVRLALFTAAIVRQTTSAFAAVERSTGIVGAPTVIELARKALDEAKESPIASYVNLDPIAREVLAFVCGPSEQKIDRGRFWTVVVDLVYVAASENSRNTSVSAIALKAIESLRARTPVEIFPEHKLTEQNGALARELLQFIIGAERSNEAEQTDAGRIRGEDPGLVPSGSVASPDADVGRTKSIPTPGAMELARELWSELRTTKMSEERIVRAIAVTLDGVRDGAMAQATDEIRQACEHLAQAGWKPHT